MQTMTKSWTDERLEERFDRIDDRFDAVDQRFDRVEADIRELRGEMKVEFRAARSEMKAGFNATQQTINRFGGGMILALLGLIATQL
jgi:DNA anti-recombination protein RmuC